MIKTKRVKLTPKDLFLILILRYVKKRWWLITFLWISAILLGLSGTANSLFFIVFAIIYPFALLIQFWIYVKSKDNKSFFLERHYEIDNEKINGIIDQDTFSTQKIELFIKAEFIQKTYLLFFSTSQFMYIPVSSFESESDREWFDNEIVKKIKTQNTAASRNV